MNIANQNRSHQHVIVLKPVINIQQLNTNNRSYGTIKKRLI